jgi:hypothetical protein
MGKAGILEGGKGDIMIPNAHINEGTADIIIFHNELNAEMFEGNDISVFCGTYGYRSWNISSKQRSIEVFL